MTFQSRRNSANKDTHPYLLWHIRTVLVHCCCPQDNNCTPKIQSSATLRRTRSLSNTQALHAGAPAIFPPHTTAKLRHQPSASRRSHSTGIISEGIIATMSVTMELSYQAPIAQTEASQRQLTTSTSDAAGAAELGSSIFLARQYHQVFI